MEFCITTDDIERRRRIRTPSVVVPFQADRRGRINSDAQGDSARCDPREIEPCTLEMALDEYKNEANYTAMEICAEILVQNPHNAHAMLFLSTIHFLLRNMERAEEYSLMAIKENPRFALPYSNIGFIYKEIGKLECALVNYKRAVELEPEQHLFHVYIATTLIALGQYESGIESYYHALGLDCGQSAHILWCDLADVLQRIGRNVEAFECHREASAIKPGYARAWTGMGTILYTSGKISPAINYLSLACALDPKLPVAHESLAKLYYNIGMFDKAEEMFRCAVKLNPFSPLLMADFGRVLLQTGLVDECIETITKAIEMEPELADPNIYSDITTACFLKGEELDAENFCQYALAKWPNHPQSWNCLGKIRTSQRRYGEAEVAFLNAIKFFPTFVEAICNLIAIYFIERQLVECFHWNEFLIRISPNKFESYANNANILYYEFHQPTLALPYFLNAIAIKPTVSQLHQGLAFCYKTMSNHHLAIRAFMDAISLSGFCERSYCEIVDSKIFICDWRSYDDDTRELVKIVRGQLERGILPTISPHRAPLFPFTLDEMRVISERHAELTEATVSHVPKAMEDFDRQLEPGGCLRIGYISADFSDHPTSHLMQAIPGLHDRDKFEVFCFALNPDDKSICRAKIALEAEHFVDLSMVVSSAEVADIIRQNKIHILVDLNGYTRGRREIYALRPAPIQVMWLGYPGTSGSKFMDYIITDRITTPLHLANAFTEKLAYMPSTYFIGDYRRMFPLLAVQVRKLKEVYENQDTGESVISPMKVVNLTSETFWNSINQKAETVQTVQDSNANNDIPENAVNTSMVSGNTTSNTTSASIQDGVNSILRIDLDDFPGCVSITTRQEHGLPDDAVVFCNLSQLYKLDPLTLQSWVNILNRVPNSVLWLLRFLPVDGDENKTATSMGLDPSRIIFANVTSKEEHVRRCQLADICLDTPLCNGHTTSMDMLYAGIPIITLPLETFQSRVAASQLTALGFPELIAQSRPIYENIAVRLGNDPVELSKLHERIWKARCTSTLFDCKNFTRELEWVFSKMWERFANGQEPDHITEADVTK